MGSYIIKRILQGVFTLYLISVAVFFVLRIGGATPWNTCCPRMRPPRISSY